jgi:acetyl esterase/lipase
MPAPAWPVVHLATVAGVRSRPSVVQSFSIASRYKSWRYREEAQGETTMTTTGAAGATTVPIGPPPPFDPELAAGLAAAAEMAGDSFRPSFRPEEIPALRQAMRLQPVTDDDLRRGGAFELEHHMVPGPPGDPDVALLICRPAGAAALVPAFYHIHGGGMIFGDNRTGLLSLLDYAKEFGAAVVSVEYRLAPEHPHPAPVEDCYAGLVWTAAHATELGIDPDRIIVRGFSAGGGLATAITLLARDRGGPALLGQVLMSPMLDDRNDTPSSFQLAGIGLWDRTANEIGWAALLGDRRGGPDVPPYAAPARATNLSGLPPAYIDAGSCETLRDETVAYAVRIWRAGGQAELHIWPGAFHGFDMLTHAALTLAADTARRAWLHRLLANQR